VREKAVEDRRRGRDVAEGLGPTFASGRLGSYLPVSMALIACVEPPRTL
jgi:hypothetical protein